MAFPGTGTTSLASTWARLQAAAGRAKDHCAALTAAVAITRRQALDSQNYLLSLRATMQSLATVPGLQTYARNEINNPTLDLTAEYLAMRNALDAVVSWVVANFPNTAGTLLVYTFDGNGTVTDIDLTAPQLSAYKTQLNGLISTIT